MKVIVRSQTIHGLNRHINFHHNAIHFTMKPQNEETTRKLNTDFNPNPVTCLLEQSKPCRKHSHNAVAGRVDGTPG